MVEESAVLSAELAHALVANRIGSARGIETVHHMALQEQLGGVAVNWFGKVTDEQYRLTK
ncbi:hypothetical protein [Edaphobacter modestus]|uniref:hypothetical protein n=1 Tax=Edaphobacter modestus TaxID=388466 RepID=UPI0013EEE950|nr:hypothetical protein [Edaphobacter modestus]